MAIHAAVWLDHERAEVFFFNRESYDEHDFHAPRHVLHSHGKGWESHHRGESHDQKAYFESIAKAVAEADEVLVLGPGTAKIQLLKHVHMRDPKVGEKIVGVETADHPTPGQIVRMRANILRAKDRMLGTSAG